MVPSTSLEVLPRTPATSTRRSTAAPRATSTAPSRAMPGTSATAPPARARHHSTPTPPAGPPPPTAAFTSNATYLQASFDGSTSSDVDGTITSYAWNFGDSATGAGPTPQHTYAAGGTYTVTLTVTDNDGHTGTTTGQVTVFDPAVQFASDGFARTVANGLGTADLGGPWTLSGAASGFSVANGVGRVAGGLAANRAAYLTGVRKTDIAMTADVALDRIATGGGAYVSLIGRRVSNGNYYPVKLRYMPDGSGTAHPRRTVGANAALPAP